MRISERIVDLTELEISSEQSAIRTPGIHCSDIIRHVAKAIKPEKENTFTEDDLNMFALIGRLWEAQLAAAKFKPPRYERIGEIECEGILLSPDSIDTQEWALGEFKVTWRSATKPVESEFKWLTQIKAYCYALGMCRCELYALYVCGAYRPPVPVAKAWSILFSPSELSENWAMLQTNMKALQKV